VLDDRRRKAVAAIGEWGHAEMLSDPGLALDPRCRDNAVEDIASCPAQFPKQFPSGRIKTDFLPSA
jgi:hypothetical protein